MIKQVNADMRNMARGYTMSDDSCDQYWDAVILVTDWVAPNPELDERVRAHNVERLNNSRIVFW